MDYTFDKNALAAHNVYRTEADAKQGALRDVGGRKLGEAKSVCLSDYILHVKDDEIALVYPRDKYDALTDAERAAIGGGR